jgi:hypothetical protein
MEKKNELDRSIAIADNRFKQNRKMSRVLESSSDSSENEAASTLASVASAQV